MVKLAFLLASPSTTLSYLFESGSVGGSRSHRKRSWPGVRPIKSPWPNNLVYLNGLSVKYLALCWPWPNDIRLLRIHLFLCNEPGNWVFLASSASNSVFPSPLKRPRKCTNQPIIIREISGLSLGLTIYDLLELLRCFYVLTWNAIERASMQNILNCPVLIDKPLPAIWLAVFGVAFWLGASLAAYQRHFHRPAFPDLITDWWCLLERKKFERGNVRSMGKDKKDYIFYKTFNDLPFLRDFPV